MKVRGEIVPQKGAGVFKLRLSQARGIAIVAQSHDVCVLEIANLMLSLAMPGEK